MHSAVGNRAMEWRDALAIAGFTYGIASDLIGSSPATQAATVPGFVMELLGTRLLGLRRQSTPSVVVQGAGINDVGQLIETGHLLRQKLMRRPGVQMVELALMGRHLVLTVTQEKPPTPLESP